MPLLHLEESRLAGQLLGRLAESSGLVLDLRMPILEPLLAFSQKTLQLGELSLAIDELLPETDQGEAMLVLQPAQILLLAVEQRVIVLDAGPGRLEIVLGLADVGRELGQMIAELFAGMAQAIDRGAGSQLDVGQFEQQLATRSRQLGQLGPFAGQGFLLRAVQLLRLRLLLGEDPVLLGELSASFAELVDLATLQFFELRELLTPAFDVGEILRQRLAPGRMFLVERGECRLLFRDAGGEAGFLLAELRLPIGELLGSLGKLVAAAAELFLESLAGLFRLGDGQAPFAEGLAFGVEASLGLRELIESGLDDRVLLRRLRDPAFDLRRLLAEMLFVPSEPILRLAKLADGIDEDRLPLGHLRAFGREQCRLLRRFGEQTLGLDPLRLAFGGDLHDAGPLRFEVHLLLTHLVADPFESAAESRQSRLLTFEGGAPLGQARIERGLFRLLQIEPGRLGVEIRTQTVQLVGLVLELGTVAEKLLFTGLQRLAAFGEIAFTLVERTLQAIEADDVGLVLAFARFEDLPLRREPILTGTDVGQLRFKGGTDLLLVGGGEPDVDRRALVRSAGRGRSAEPSSSCDFWSSSCWAPAWRNRLSSTSRFCSCTLRAAWSTASFSPASRSRRS